MQEPKARRTDIATLRQRERAREHLEDGAVTTDYRADRKQVLRLLNEALATELVCWLRYRRHYFIAKGIHAEVAAAEFLQHSNQEAQHAVLATEEEHADDLAGLLDGIRN